VKKPNKETLLIMTSLEVCQLASWPKNYLQEVYISKLHIQNHGKDVCRYSDEVTISGAELDDILKHIKVCENTEQWFQVHCIVPGHEVLTNSETIWWTQDQTIETDKSEDERKC